MITSRAMLACALLLLAHALGMLLAAGLDVPLRASGRVGFGLAFAQALLAWVPFLFARAFDLDARTAGSSAIVTLALACAAAGLALRRAPLAQRLRIDMSRGALVLCGGLTLLFAWLLHTHFLLPQPDGLYSAGVTWGDLPMHLALATRFLYWEGLPPLEHPLHLHGPLAYPFLPDYGVAVLAALGLPLRWAFVVAGLLPFIALLLLVRALARLWHGDAVPAAAWLATGLFFFAGGLGFAWFVPQWLGGADLHTLLATTNYTYFADDTILKAGHLGNLFVAARTATPGMALGVAAIWLLGHLQQSESVKTRHVVLAGVLAASLPWIHPHSFLVVCGVALWYAVFGTRREPRWAWLIVPLVVGALPQALALQRSSAEHSFVRVSLGFLREADGVMPWATDLTLGLGASLLLLPWAWRAASPTTRRLALPLLCLLPIACVITFTPTAYDNIKLIAWFDLAAAILLAGWLARAMQRSRFTLVGFSVVACTFSGLLAVGHELTNRARVVEHADLRLADLVRKQLPPTAIVATASSGHDPVAMFSGRRTLLAAPYMLGTHGIDVRPRALDVVRLYAGGPPAREVIERLGVHAVVVGPRERADLRVVNEAWIAAHAVAKHTTDGRTLYVLRSVR